MLGCEIEHIDASQDPWILAQNRNTCRFVQRRHECSPSFVSRMMQKDEKFAKRGMMLEGHIGAWLSGGVGDFRLWV